MAIIISKNGQNAKRVDQSIFDREAHLQQYIYDNPDSIPLYDVKEDIKLLILAREFSTESGPIDAIGVDRDGDIYIIETKLYKNPDKRTVVAQAMDYGASLWRHGTDFNSFISQAEESVNAKFKMSVADKLKEYFEIDDSGLELLYGKINRNLDGGIFKFVILMDHLHDQLKDLIVFINENSKFDIYAVELEYYKHDEYEILIPRLFGAEVKKDISITPQSSARRRWDEEGFLADAQTKLDAISFDAVKKLYEFAKNIADEISFGTGVANSSFSPKINKISSKSIFTVRSDGVLSFNTGWLNDNSSTEKFRDGMVNELRNIEGLSIADDYIDRYPKFRIDVWRESTPRIIKAIEVTLAKCG